MNKTSIKNTFFAICFASLLIGCSNHNQEIKQFANQSKKNPIIKNIGQNRYKIGNILINKSKQSFEITGKILRLEPPIEFLAVTKGGSRGYESFLELDTNTFEFNLACILIGLHNHKAAPPKFQFDTTVLKGGSIEIWISWQINNKTYRFEATNLLQLNNEKIKSKEWVYTGSGFLPDAPGGYMAEVAGGTLIGLIHAPESIIEHRFGFGNGSFKDLIIDKSIPAHVNMPITVQIKYEGS